MPKTLFHEMDLKVAELTLSGVAKCPKARLRMTKAESFEWVWVLSRVGKGVKAIKLLDLAAARAYDETHSRTVRCTTRNRRNPIHSQPSEAIRGDHDYRRG